MTKPHERWLYFADQDRLSMDSLLRDEIYPQACFHAQQAVEKTMKAYLVAYGRKFRKTHGLLYLAELMQVDWLSSYMEALRRLSEFYVPSRYPDAIVGTLPDGLPDKYITEGAVRSAEELCQLIRKHL